MGSEVRRASIAGNGNNPAISSGQDCIPSLPIEPKISDHTTDSQLSTLIPTHATDDTQSIASTESERPPLPPRPKTLHLLEINNQSLNNTPHVEKKSLRPQLQSYATTAVSRTDIQTQLFPDGSRETYANSARSTPSGKSFRLDTPTSTNAQGRNGSDMDDSVSVQSYAPTVGAGEYAESLLGDVFGSGQQSSAWRLLHTQIDRVNTFDVIPYDGAEPTADFSREFDELDDVAPDGRNEGI